MSYEELFNHAKTEQLKNIDTNVVRMFKEGFDDKAIIDTLFVTFESLPSKQIIPVLTTITFLLAEMRYKQSNKEE